MIEYKTLAKVRAIIIVIFCVSFLINSKVLGREPNFKIDNNNNCKYTFLYVYKLPGEGPVYTSSIFYSCDDIEKRPFLEYLDNIGYAVESKNEDELLLYELVVNKYNSVQEAQEGYQKFKEEFFEWGLLGITDSYKWGFIETLYDVK